MFAGETQNMRERREIYFQKKHLSMLVHAQELAYRLKELMPTQYQKDNLEAMLELFLPALEYPLPEHSKTKSTREFKSIFKYQSLINQRDDSYSSYHPLQTVLKMLSSCGKGADFLQIIIDLTTLEKRDKFKSFENLIRVDVAKRGLHLVVVYLVIRK
ncbi:hypothetical protein [Gloeocapsopsis dulcis]|uniref:hypothetical protein n=1 Tax=Gloeocapsopsis dulcis TaxID=2859516 RepID=UPI00101AE3B2|nr:hypothetical protein [Gloeocapsopsis dulcis]WNN92124.1 hypothetical protein P0S91_26435 [Gloeocapsopsis dulcis]